MLPLLEGFDSILRDRCGLHKDAPIVAGVSGGPDSLCLLDLLVRSGYPVVAAHFNHRLRPEADSDVAEVAGIAASLSVPFASESADVHQYARRNGLSIEAAGRELRYGFLFAEARARGAQAVAVGHTADDQVETILMNFIRGTGLRGLGGMAHRTVLRVFDPSIPLVRPLLGFERHQTESYCASRGLRPVYDASNDLPDYFRNRVRNELIPFLEQYNPRLREVMRRNSAALSADQDLLDELVTAEWLQSIIRQDRDSVAFDLARLQERSPRLQRQLIRRAASQLAPTDQMDFAALDRAAAFIARSAGTHTDLAGGLRLHREADVLYLAKQDAVLPAEAWPQMPSGADLIDVSLPGVAVLAGGWCFEATTDLAPPFEAGNLRSADRFQAQVDVGSLSGSLELRVRRPGDRIQPLGLAGHTQKLADFFINEKVPARARARWPLLCIGDAVVWVPGYGLAEPFKVLASSRKIAHLWIKQPTPR